MNTKPEDQTKDVSTPSVTNQSNSAPAEVVAPVAPQPTATPRPSKAPKKLILLIAGLVVFAGLAYGAYAFFLKGDKGVSSSCAVTSGDKDDECAARKKADEFVNYAKNEQYDEAAGITHFTISPTLRSQAFSGREELWQNVDPGTGLAKFEFTPGGGPHTIVYKSTFQGDAMNVEVVVAHKDGIGSGNLPFDEWKVVGVRITKAE